jgi:enoyl-CoA hydratase/carnithine racemase
MICEFAEVEADGRVLTVTLNRPEARNALHAAANHELGKVFDAFEADPDLWVAIVTGAGDKAFSAGADLKQVGILADDAIPPSGFAGLTHRFDRTKPVIAAVGGFARGGGFELALACDLIIAAETASFGLSEPRVGLAAMGGGIQRIVRELGPKRAHALLLTARPSPRAKAWRSASSTRWSRTARPWPRPGAGPTRFSSAPPPRSAPPRRSPIPSKAVASRTRCGT